MSVHLSQAVTVLKLLDKLSWFIAGVEAFFDLSFTVLCYGKNWISPEISLNVYGFVIDF